VPDLDKDGDQYREGDLRQLLMGIVGYVIEVTDGLHQVKFQVDYTTPPTVISTSGHLQ